MIEFVKDVTNIFKKYFRLWPKVPFDWFTIVFLPEAFFNFQLNRTYEKDSSLIKQVEKDWDVLFEANDEDEFNWQKTFSWEYSSTSLKSCLLMK